MKPGLLPPREYLEELAARLNELNRADPDFVLRQVYGTAWTVSPRLARPGLPVMVQPLLTFERRARAYQVSALGLLNGLFMGPGGEVPFEARVLYECAEDARHAVPEALPPCAPCPECGAPIFVSQLGPFRLRPDFLALYPPG